MACCISGEAQTNDSDLIHVRDEFLATVFTQCNGHNYFLGWREVNQLACTIPNSTNTAATAREITDCAEMIEYKDLDFVQSVAVLHPGSSPETMALRPAGIFKLPRLRTDPPGLDRALLLVTFKSFRSQMRVSSRRLMSASGSQRDMEPWGRPVPNVSSPLSFISLLNERYRFPPGTKAFGVITREDGRWHFALGPDIPIRESLSQILGRVGIDGGPVASLTDEPVRTLGMTAILNSVGGSRFLMQELTRQKPKSCDEIPAVQQEVAQDEFRQLIKADSQAAAAAPTFEGSADEFAKRLPEWVRTAAHANGFNPENFSRETEYVASTVRTCLTITDDMAASVKDRSSGVPHTFKLGKPYMDCGFGDHSASLSIDPTNGANKLPFMAFNIAPPAASAKLPVASQRWSNGFQIKVSFIGGTPGYHYVVLATINPPAR